MNSVRYTPIVKPISSTSSPYDPGAMLNAIMRRIGADSDTELAAHLQMDLAIIERIREGRLRVSPSMLHAIHYATNIPVDDLRRLLKDRRRSFR